jgi:putative ABC transport system substrate-binding protein
LAPDAILAHGTSTVTPLLQATRSVPIVFAVVADPVGAGIVQSQARPGGNATGFMNFDYSIGAKWLELLKEIAPEVTRVAVLRDAANPTGIAAFSVIQAIAPLLRVEVTPVNMIDADEIERQVAASSPSVNTGLILTPSGLAQLHGNLIVTLAARQKLTAVYFERSFVARGDWSRTDLISPTNTVAPQATSIASCAARSLPTYRCKRRPSTNWSSISKPRRRSASKCRRRCSPALTK